MPQKLTAKSKKKENSGIPRVKPQEVAVSLDQFVKKKSRPLIPIVDETKWFRQQKRDEKREKQRRNDVAKSAEAHLEKAIDSFKVMSTESE